MLVEPMKQWNKIDIKVQESKRLMELEVHQEGGVEKANS